MKNFVEELRWRGMLQDMMPGAEEYLQQQSVSGYIGFDPTADSLHVGSLVQIMILKHFQNAGHKPIALVGGATGLIGDPSGKKEERKLLSEEDVEHNVTCIKKQLEKFLDFKGANAAELVNNADWFKHITTIRFLRDAGKYLTVSYLLNKGFVKDRLAQDQELSFTEFNYILMQAYDFLWLYENKNCKIQMGGSDQWGNITAGTELIRKKIRGEAYGVTCKLLVKADGTKFGKTESGNIWLDPKRTSPYKFYQFWMQASDVDAENYIKIFTLFERDKIESIIREHTASPHMRLLQKELAKDITIRVHSLEDYQNAVRASEILFGKSTKESFETLDEKTFLELFEGVPQFPVQRDTLAHAVALIDLLTEHTQTLPSKSEFRRAVKEHSLSLNKEKVSDAEKQVSINDFIKGKYLLVKRGKSENYLIVAE